MKKRCSRCERERLLKFFRVDKRYRLGVSCWCRDCFNRYAQTPEAKKIRNQRWVEYVSIPANREYERVRSLQKYDPEKAKDRRLRRIGTSLKKFKVAKRCALCHRKHRLVADHNHKTSLYRGAICHLCNLILGHVERFPKILKRISIYLRRGHGVSLHQR